MSLVEKVLKDAITVCNTDISKTDEEIKELNIIRHNIAEDRRLLFVELQKVCQHLRTDKTNSSYTSGGYDYVSEEYYEIKCLDCSKVLDSKLIRGTYA